jgi:hypothetical protein
VKEAPHMRSSIRTPKIIVQCVYFCSFKVTCVGADLHFILCQRIKSVEQHLPVELCALVHHEHVDNWNVGTCDWVGYHDDKALIEEMRCA